MKKTLIALVSGVVMMGSALAQTATAPAKDAMAPKPAAMAPAPAAAAPAATPAKPATPAKAATPAKPAAAPAAGGGAGKVWVNGKVFHCEGTKYYGKTKQGSYMSIADAKAKGAHMAKGQTCDK